MNQQGKQARAINLAPPGTSSSKSTNQPHYGQHQLSQTKVRNPYETNQNKALSYSGFMDL